MKYTYEELQIMVNEYKKALYVIDKFVEVDKEFLMSEEIKPLYKKFLMQKMKEELENISKEGN